MPFAIKIKLASSFCTYSMEQSVQIFAVDLSSEDHCVKLQYSRIYFCANLLFDVKPLTCTNILKVELQYFYASMLHTSQTEKKNQFVLLMIFVI